MLLDFLVERPVGRCARGCSGGRRVEGVRYAVVIPVCVNGEGIQLTICMYVGVSRVSAGVGVGGTV